MPRLEYAEYARGCHPKPMRGVLLYVAAIVSFQAQTVAAGRDQSQVVLQEQIAKKVAEERARSTAAKTDPRSVLEICRRGRPKAAC